MAGSLKSRAQQEGPKSRSSMPTEDAQTSSMKLKEKAELSHMSIHDTTMGSQSTSSWPLVPFPMATGKAETEVREEATESSDPFRTSFFPDRRVISVRAFPFPYPKSGFIWAWVDTVSID